MIVNPFPLSLEHSFPTAWSGGGSIHNFGVPFLGGLLWQGDLHDSNKIGYGPPCARARGGPRARGPALVLGYRGRSNRQGFSPHGEVKMI